MFSFNLVDQNWLPCVMADGTMRELRLRDVFIEAHNIRELIGDSPPETIALHRMLLAIIHRALKGPKNSTEWGELKTAKKFDAATFNEYLDKWHSRFDLFDETYPFYQSASAKTNVQPGAIIQLYFQAKANATLFDHSSLEIPKEVSPSKAARLLIMFQAFDTGGIKADGPGGKRAALLNCAVALIYGQNLFQTLLFNLHKYSENDEEPFALSFEADKPAWEKGDVTEVKERIPNGYVDLLTWQSRRILFKPESNSVGHTVIKDCVIMKGFYFPNDYQFFGRETMVAFRKNDKAGMLPIGFNENKSLWRNSLSLFQTVVDTHHRPRILDWINDLEYEGFIKELNVIPVNFFGLKNDVNNEAKLILWQQDRFNLPVQFLKENNLLNYLSYALHFAESSGSILYKATKELATELLLIKASPKEQKTPDPKHLSNLTKTIGAEKQFWSRLETQFHRLLKDLPESGETALFEWFGFVDQACKTELQNTLNGLGGSAGNSKAFAKAERKLFLERHILLFGSKKIQGNSMFRKYLQINEKEVN